MSKHSIEGAAALLLIVAAACGQPKETTERATVNAPTEIVRAGQIAETRSVAGSVRAATISPIAAKVMGNVVRVLVREGDRVHAGQLLIEIDDRAQSAQSDRAGASRAAMDDAIGSANAAIASAEANAALAATNFKRYAALRERGSVSPAEFDDAQAKQRVAAAELDRARRIRDQIVSQRSEAAAAVRQAGISVDDTRVRAPIDGIVTARFVDPGAQAAPGMPLLTIEDDRQYRVDASAPEDLAVRPGDPVRVEAAGKRFDVRVTQVVAALDATSRSAIVKIDLPHDAALRSGAFANVAFTTGVRNGIVIPAAAVQRQGDVSSVFVVGSDAVARLRLITTGDVTASGVEVLSGLDPGERIVAATAPALRDGVALARIQ